MNIPFFSPTQPIDNRRLLNLALFLTLILSIILLTSLYAAQGKRVRDLETVAETPDPFFDLKIEAKSAIVYDIVKGTVMYEKDADTIHPLASLTKVLTAVTAAELLPKDSVITIRHEFLAEEGDSGFYTDEEWSLSDLIDFSLVASSNDGVAAIAGAAGALQRPGDPSVVTRSQFIENMNATARAINMSNSKFSNESGLDLSLTESGAYGTARDMATLMTYAMKNHPEVLAATRYSNISVSSLNNLTHNAENTNTALDSIPAVLASKTGFTDLAGGNLMIIFDPGFGRPVAAVVLGSSYDGRFTDMKTLVEKTMEYVSLGK